MQIQGRWQGRFGQVFSDLYPRSTTFASLHLRAFAFLSSNKPGSLREIHYLCVFAPSRLCVPFLQQPGSLREIHYLCVFAPSRLCVPFLQQAGISARDPLPLRLCNLMNVLLKVMMEFQDLRPA
jgi:hypothetical protein